MHVCIYLSFYLFIYLSINVYGHSILFSVPASGLGMGSANGIKYAEITDEILAGFSVDPLDYQALFERERSEVRDQTHPAR